MEIIVSTIELTHLGQIFLLAKKASGIDITTPKTVPKKAIANVSKSIYNKPYWVKLVIKLNDGVNKPLNALIAIIKPLGLMPLKVMVIDIRI